MTDFKNLTPKEIEDWLRRTKPNDGQEPLTYILIQQRKAALNELEKRQARKAKQ